MKKKYFRIICAFLVLCLLFSGCAVEGGEDSLTVAEEVTSRENVLKAWEGEFSEDALVDAIAEYRSNYQPVVGALPVTIEADFDIESYTVARISKVNDSDVEVELNGYIDLIIDTARDGEKITVNTDWWQSEGENTQRYTVWSYLVLVRDTEGGEHYYYFRVDYSSQGTPVEYLTPDQTEAGSREPDEVARSFREAYADFALKLLNESRAVYEGDGLLVSPLSAMIALAMTANGAEGQTLTEMEKVLGGSMPIAKLSEELCNYTASLISTDDAKFNMANAIWVTSNPAFSINKNFVDTVGNTFDADVIAADLPNSIGAINDWAKKETFGMIPSILKDGDLDELSVMVLLNALALDALWANQPNDEACFEDVFKGTDENVQKATFMWTECDGYLEGKNVTGIVKNYKGGNYAFLALLPEGNVYEYAASLDGKELLKLYDKREVSAYNVDIRAKMPHFSFDCSIEMEKVLINMGMPTAFNSSAADFDGLGKDTRGNLYISRVIQKTHIDLDNSGTRAAAVTAVIMVPECAIPEVKSYQVELDRPFVYAIIDTENGLPVFLGICDNVN